MPGPAKILVAVDFSQHSAAAVEDAFLLADKFEATVHLLHVFTLQDKRESSVFSEDELRELQADERRKLEALEDARRSSGRVGEVLWREGDPGSQVVVAATQLQVDLIVLGASGRTGLTRIVLGSVAESVVKNASCSVWVVRRTS